MRKVISQKLYWEKVAKSYDKLVGKKGDLSHEKIINPIVTRFLGDLKGKTVLDAGCGNGYWSMTLAKKAKKVVGIDFSEELIKAAELRYSAPNLEFITRDLRKLNFPDNNFDIVLCNMALMDVEDLDKAIAEMARVLKVKGNLV